VALPVEGMDPDVDADMLLFEASLELREGGAYSFGPSFVVGFTRQFSFEDEEGEYAGMEVVRAELRYAVHDDFRAITRMRHETSGRPTSSGGPAVRARRSGRSASRRAAVTRSPSSIGR